MASDYWKKRVLKQKSSALTDAEDSYAELTKRLDPVQKEIERLVGAFAEKYAAADGTIDATQAQQLMRGKELQGWRGTLDDWEAQAKAGGYDRELNMEYYRSRVSRLQALEAQIANIMAKAAAEETPKMAELLKKTYTDTYHSTLYNTQMMSGSVNVDFARLNDDKLDTIIRNQWHGTDFKKGVWKNYTRELPSVLKSVVTSGVALGQSRKQMVDAIGATLRGVEKYKIWRLVNTESAHIAEQATLMAYQESDIKEYEYIAALESRTCDECRFLDGKTFAVDNEIVGENYPTIHPNCRCTTAPYFKDHSEADEPEMSFENWSDIVDLA